LNQDNSQPGTIAIKMVF